IYLSPKVILSLMRGEGRRFLDFYTSLIKSMDLVDRFESYESLFMFFFPTEKHVQAFAHSVRLLGGTAPKDMVPLPLTDLQLALLKIIMVKEGLDRMVEEWDESSLECLVKLLCEYARLLLCEREPQDLEMDSTDIIELAVPKAKPGKPSEGCPREFLDHISSRKGRRTGLTVRELSAILGGTDLNLKNPFLVVNANLNELERAGMLMVSEGRRGRTKKKGGETRKGFPVRTFHLNYGHMMVSHLERLMEEAVDKAYRGMVKNSCF
ncbi:MAG: hypothetical protein QI199_08935, partial [Candidatus Korarchaeota archaeon]|nr:hypothetical protein [Candidatus Korarchaeota archaeon]